MGEMVKQLTSRTWAGRGIMQTEFTPRLPSTFPSALRPPRMDHQEAILLAILLILARALHPSSSFYVLHLPPKPCPCF